MMLIQHSIYTPLIAPGAIPSLCKNHVLGAIKGVLHPRPVFGLFLHFSQKLQHIDNK